MTDPLTDRSRRLPSGTVTFLFTDVEGSTRLLYELGAELYAEALAAHRQILREAFVRHDGVEVDTQGDAFFVAFPTAAGALEAAKEATEALASGPIRVRMGVHTGTPHLAVEGYVGADVHRAARIAAAGHGGQVLVSATTAALVGAHELVDLGEHRLKDLSAPERIFQLGSREFPRLRSLHQTNLPVPATSFLGRETELAEIEALLRRPDVRLVTLTGPGGTGKTRLALQAAGAAADSFPDGVWWVPLAALREGELVIPAAAQALGAQGDVAEHIADGKMLLAFDNFEQVAAAAPEVGRLLARCPQLKILVTSREPLHLGGEWEYTVDPLREPEAVALFEARALAAQRDFSPNGEVRAICARLDNLPLAIELAAARVKMLSARALLERLEQRLPILAGGARDAPERQRTLRATIEWSHDILTPDEQRLFARLAVFRGGWALDAAEAIVEAALDTLQSLVDKSLIRRRDERFWMLETIREFATERLEGSSEAADLRRRHAEHFLQLAEAAEPHLRGNPKKWADRLEADHDNVRAAFDTFEASGESEHALRLAGAMTQFWYLRNNAVEGRRRLEQALARDERGSAARAKALVGAGVMAFADADLEAAAEYAERALELYRELGDRAGAAYSAMVLGNALGESRQEAAALRAQKLLEESVEGFRELGDVEAELRAAYNLASVSGDLVGEQDRERAILEDNLRRARALGLERDESMALGGLARFARREGRIDEAISMLARCVRIERDIGDLAWTANNLGRLADTFIESERLETAAIVLGSAVALHDQIGLRWAGWAATMIDEVRTAAEAGLGEAGFNQAFEAGRHLTIDQALAVALANGQSTVRSS